MQHRTNIEIDVELLKKAMNISNTAKIKDVVHMALRELIAMYQRKSLLKLKGKVKWEGNLDEMREVW